MKKFVSLILVFVVIAVFFLLIIIRGCSCDIDVSKIDSTYFVGTYICDLDGKIEKIDLKANGWYDYYWEPKNIKIENIGRWWFYKENKHIILDDFPNYRKGIEENAPEDKQFYISFGVDYCSKELDFLDSDERFYIFRPEKK
ncbi:MAG: hypothetical protein KatS3mg035_2150 [Bacteroidia bacterium]|nr:MAG: hypothetical protein KatS3mg035_2150 [Bacteroidia bacterium]